MASERNRQRRKPQSRAKLLMQTPEADPMSSVANLFDVAMVFAVALLLAMVSAMKAPEIFFSDDTVTLVKNPGQPDMEILKREGTELKHYKMSEASGSGEGQRLGICYRLESGEVIYVPESDEAGK